MKQRWIGRRIGAAVLSLLLVVGNVSGNASAESENQISGETSSGTVTEESETFAEIEGKEVENSEEGFIQEKAEISEATSPSEREAAKEEVPESENGVPEDSVGAAETAGEELPEDVENVPEENDGQETSVQQEEEQSDSGDRNPESFDAQEMMFDDEVEEELSAADSALASAAVTEGTAIASSGSAYKLVSAGSDVYKGNYNLLGDSNNRSRFVYTPFSNAGSNVKYFETGGVIYFVPVNDSAAGQYGFLVQNVGFNCEENCGLDMRFTVTGYKNYVFDKNGDKVEGIYPAFGFWKNYGLCFAFGGADQNIQIEILKHGTNTPVQGDYSFRWLDIDAGQRFGMSLADGTLSGRYALKSCSAFYQDGFSRFNKTYQMVNAAQDTDYSGKTGNWMDGTVYWEVKNCSRMNLLIATAGNASQGRRSEKASRERYKSYSTGNFSEETGVDLGLLAWDGESYGARENPSALYKYVSNDELQPEALAQNTSNILSSAADSFYYYLTNHVPVESPDYYYNLYTVTDTLPPGVDYGGELQVIKAETGQDVTAWFKTSAEEDVITFQAVNLSDSAFYGSTYVFKIQAKVDLSELSPERKGNILTYQMENQATVSSRHKTDAAPKSALSNKTVTTLQELGTGKLCIKKNDEEKKPLDGATFEIRAAADIMSPTGKILIKANTLADTVTTAQGQALSKELYAGSYIVTEVSPPAGYSLTSQPQTVEISASSNEKAQAELTFTNPMTLVYLQKVSELLEGESVRTALSGVSFSIWEKGTDEGDAASYVTDENGLIAIRGLRPGTYCYRECAVPTGYVTDLKYGEFVIDEKGLTEGEYGHHILVENSCIKTSFCKIDKSTGQPVEGATLQLTDQNGKIIETWVSEATPHRIYRLPAGTYTLSEQEAPEGYKKGQPVTCVVKDTPTLQNYTLSDTKYVTITLIKTIHNSQIVWAHGNPTFTFGLTGTDLDGDSHTKYQTVVFDAETVQAKENTSMEVTFIVPAGIYTAFEEKTARYTLEAITGISNGEILDGDRVRFNLTKNQNGAATFVNQKVSDELLSHTDYVKNVVVP